MAYRTDTADTVARPTAASVPDTSAKNRPDNHIWGVYCIMIFFSIVELYSASSFEIAKQGLYKPLISHVSMLFLGLVLILVIQKIHYRYFAPATKLLTVGSILAMLYVLFFGQVINGAKRAIALPGFTLQPAEFIKLSAVLILAYVLASTQLKKDERKRNRGIVFAAAIVIVFGALLFTQGLTNTLILMIISLAMLCIGTLEVRKLGIVLAVYFVVALGALGVKMAMTKEAPANVETPVLVDSKGNTFTIPEAADHGGGDTRMTSDTWEHRIKSFFNSTPAYERPITPENLQEMRSYMAQANGGLFGVMPGNSRETSRLPLAFSDYIFAIIVEDLGFVVGGLGLMTLYLWLLARAYFIARQCKQMYPAFLVVGCAVLITFQALCHMAIVSGAGPVSGQPLPLFSRGGTSIIVTSIAFGVMLSVSRFALRDSEATAAEIRKESNTLPEQLRGANPINN